MPSKRLVIISQESYLFSASGNLESNISATTTWAGNGTVKDFCKRLVRVYLDSKSLHNNLCIRLTQTVLFEATTLLCKSLKAWFCFGSHSDLFLVI